MTNIAPAEAETWIRDREDCVVLDVREPWEFNISRLKNALNIPLRCLQQRLHELKPSVPYLVYCHHGSRSLFACAIMKRAGFQEVFNLHGGIDRWSVTLDPTLKRY